MLLRSLVALANATLLAAQVAHGPCHIESRGLTCTRNGYYEMTQCTATDCFCVAANNGHIAEETRTGSSKSVPTCSKCLLTLREMFSSFSLSSTSYVPTCDTRNGDYTAIQCHPSRKECWCVNSTTGEEVKGTRKVQGNNVLMQCGPTTGAKDPSRFPTALKGKKVEYPIAKETCKLAADRGQRCAGKQPRVMYYFDANHADCFAFEYLGCGGNDNRYVKRAECHSSCQLMDAFSCAGLLEPSGICFPGGEIAPPPPPSAAAAASGKQLSVNFTMPKPKPLCPEGYTCMMGAFHGLCCNEEVEAFYRKEYEPTCPNGGRPHVDNDGDWDQIRLGTSCSHNFCPSTRHCTQGKLFAFCC